MSSVTDLFYPCMVNAKYPCHVVSQCGRWTSILQLAQKRSCFAVTCESEEPDCTATQKACYFSDCIIFISQE
jgi:hypothetical protein